MPKSNNDFYNELGIKQAEKNTESGKAKKKLKRVKHFINSRLFRDLDFIPDEEELNDGIEGF